MIKKYRVFALIICALAGLMGVEGCQKNAPSTEPAPTVENTEQTPTAQADSPNTAAPTIQETTESDSDKPDHPTPEVQEPAHPSPEIVDNTEALDAAKINPHLRDFPFETVDSAITEAQARSEAGNHDDALRLLLEAQYVFGNSDDLKSAYDGAYRAHPNLNAEPKKLEIDQDVTGIKRIGGGSSLVYRLLKNKETIAAFKPFQKRFQSNYRSEIAAYRLCPLIKCGFDIPVNLPVYFDYHDFSGLYARIASNPKEEFSEIIPTKMPDGSHHVEGTFKDWIPDFADYPIEFKNIWMPWLNPGVAREELFAPMSDLIPVIAKRHKGGEKFAKKLLPHLENVDKYTLARQISNMLVFDFLMNNWDRFSGSPTLYGVNCQIVKGRFMSIDNGAAFPKTPNPKPEQHLHEISRFSRATYEAIVDLEADKERVNNILFPNPSDVERDRLETFWSQRQKYLKYVKECIVKNGEDETFFFE